jgi:pyridoxamine 5'-phosphate oxidase
MDITHLREEYRREALNRETLRTDPMEQFRFWFQQAQANVSACFLWLGLERQVIINGPAERIPASESLAYFITRPLGSQLGAWSSNQSTVIKSRSLLEAKLNEMKQKFADGKIPLPSFWGGYRIVPESYEFWQGRQSRLHDRFRYQKTGDTWDIERLQP